jgi:transposase
MKPMYYIGLDVHKRKISYCVKDSSGQVYAEGVLPAARADLDLWMKTLPQPWSAAMEATMFTGWIYDHLKPHAAALKVAHPLMLRAIAAAKGTPAEKPTHAAKNQKEFTPALLPSASGELLPS